MTTKKIEIKPSGKTPEVQWAERNDNNMEAIAYTLANIEYELGETNKHLKELVNALYETARR